MCFNLLVVLIVQKSEGTVLLRLVPHLVKIISRVAIHGIDPMLIEGNHLLLLLAALVELLDGGGVYAIPHWLAHPSSFLVDLFNNI